MREDMPRFLRLADVDVAGKRVFIRSDLNVPQDERRSDHRRHAHPRLVARDRDRRSIAAPP